MIKNDILLLALNIHVTNEGHDLREYSSRETPESQKNANAGNGNEPGIQRDGTRRKWRRRLAEIISLD